MSDMTTAEIKAAKAMAEAATAGPWELVRSATCGHLRAAHNYNHTPELEWTSDDIAFINNARTLVPRLADECLRLRGEIAEYEENEAERNKLRESIRDDARKALHDALGKRLWNQLWGPELEALGSVVYASWMDRQIAIQERDALRDELAAAKAGVGELEKDRNACSASEAFKDGNLEVFKADLAVMRAERDKLVERVDWLSKCVTAWEDRDKRSLREQTTLERKLAAAREALVEIADRTKSAAGLSKNEICRSGSFDGINHGLDLAELHDAAAAVLAATKGGM